MVINAIIDYCTVDCYLVLQWEELHKTRVVVLLMMQIENDYQSLNVK